MAITNLLSTAAQYVRSGYQFDSFRRQVFRELGSVAGLGLQNLWVEATNTFANQSFLEDMGPSFVPTRERGMIARPFKEPWRYRYVANVNFTFSDGTFGETNFSLYSNTANLSAEEIQEQLYNEAYKMANEGGQSDIGANATDLKVTLVNAYYNE